MNQQVCGLLARQWTGKRLSLQVLQSAAGFYVGTCDADGPVSRESNEYFATREAAEQALAGGHWSPKTQP